MTKRYIIKPDPDNEQWKIIDTGTIIGTEDLDHEWVATTADYRVAEHIKALLTLHPHCKSNR